MRVFLATNALVSAFIARGLCADLVELVLEEHELVASEAVILELRRVLADKLGVPDVLVDRAERLVRQGSVVPTPDTHLALDLRDPDDEWVVAGAAASRADLLVTGDADLLDARERIPLPVVTPRQAWPVLRGRSSLGSPPGGRRGDP